MIISGLFFLAAVVAVVVIVLYTRNRRKQNRMWRHEPTLTMRQIPEEGVGKVRVIQREESKPTVTNPKVSHSTELVVLHLLAKSDCPYAGYELLQALLAVGLRFGDMEIFHRHEQMNGTGDILFSVASVKKPGNFELSKMGGFKTPGLVLFAQLSRVKDARQVLDAMLSTARQLAEDLGGDIYDEKRELLTEEKANQLEQRIADYEKKHQTADLFANT